MLDAFRACSAASNVRICLSFGAKRASDGGYTTEVSAEISNSGMNARLKTTCSNRKPRPATSAATDLATSIPTTSADETRMNDVLEVCMTSRRTFARSAKPSRRKAISLRNSVRAATSDSPATIFNKRCTMVVAERREGSSDGWRNQRTTR